MNDKNVGTHTGASATSDPHNIMSGNPDAPVCVPTSTATPDAPVCVPTQTASAAGPQRKSPRAKFHDYSGGIYFVTICTQDKTHYFGKIVNDELAMTEIGIIAHKELEAIPSHFPYAEVPHFVVMPNHIHAIIIIDRNAGTQSGTPDAPVCVPTKRTGLSVIIGCYKQSVTMFARRNGIDFAWQSRYHDRIARNQDELNRVSNYITCNPSLWGQDRFNS